MKEIIGLYGYFIKNNYLCNLILIERKHEKSTEIQEFAAPYVGSSSTRQLFGQVQLRIGA